MGAVHGQVLKDGGVQQGGDKGEGPGAWRQVVDDAVQVELVQPVRVPDDFDVWARERSGVETLGDDYPPSSDMGQEELEYGPHTGTLSGVVQRGVVPPQDEDVEGMVSRSGEILANLGKWGRVPADSDDEARPEHGRV